MVMHVGVSVKIHEDNVFTPFICVVATTWIVCFHWIKVHTGWLTNSIGYMVCSFCQWWMVRVKRSSCFRMYLTRLYQRIPMTFLMSPRHGSISFSHALDWRIFLHTSSSFLFAKCLWVLHVAWLLLGAVFHSFHCRTCRPPTKHVSE